MSCDIEKLLFNKIKIWHSFDYYLEDFFKYFFSNIDLTTLKLKYNEQLEKENKELYEYNLKKINDLEFRIKYTVNSNITKKNLNEFRELLDKMYGI